MNITANSIDTRVMSYEQWLEVPGFEEEYKISNNGRVFSVERNGTKGGILKPSQDRYGYLKVVLYKNNKRHHLTIHRIVALAFIEKPENKNQVNHKNGIRTDNRVSNLEWVTAKENVYHSFRFGKQRSIMRPFKAIDLKTNEETIFPSQRAAARSIGCCQANIQRALTGEFSQSHGYRFLYIEGGDES